MRALPRHGRETPHVRHRALAFCPARTDILIKPLRRLPAPDGAYLR